MDRSGYLGLLLLLIVVQIHAQQRSFQKNIKDAIDDSDSEAAADFTKAIQDALKRGELLSDHPRTGYACEGSTLRIACAEGHTIRVVRANYGRFSMRPCHQGSDTANWDLQCMSLRSLPIVNDMCTGKSECWVQSANRMFGDPCPDTPKYLEAEFKCIKDSGEEVVPRTRPPPPKAPTTTTTTIPTTTTTTETTTTTTSTTTSPSTTTPTPTPTVPEDLGPEVKFCDQTWIRNVSWPKTKMGKIVYRPCPNNQYAQASWECRMGPKVQWKGHPDLSKCVSPIMATMGKKVHNAERILRDASATNDLELAEAKQAAAAEIVEEVAAEMIMVSQDTVYGGDLDSIAKVMEDMVSYIDVRTLNVTKPRAKKLVKDVNQAVVQSSSNLLDRKQKPAWRDLPQSNQAQAATRVVNSVEQSAFSVAETYEKPERHVTVDINIVLEINVIDTMGPGRLNEVEFPSRDHLGSSMGRENWAANGNSIRLSGNTIKQFGVDGLAKLIFATYNNLEEYLQPPQGDQPVRTDPPTTTAEAPVTKGLDPSVWDDDDESFNMIPEVEVMDVEQQMQEEEDNSIEQVVNTNIISASINGRKEIQELPEPVIYVLEHKNQKNIFNPTCSFWNYEERTMTGHWSSFGCKLVDTNVTHSTCSCNHMTNFAILMDVSGTVLSDRHNIALQLLTYVGCIISIVCLLISFITFVFIKNLQCDRNTIHKNLCLCLCIAQIVFIAGIVQHDKKILCSVIAGVLHYFLLAAFMWMFLEGLQLYVMLIEVFESEKSRRWYYYAAGYGVPAVIIGIAAGVFPGGYGTETHCWLTTERGFIWAFVGPVIVVISINIFMLAIAIYKMCEHAKNVSSWKMKEKSRLQSIKEESYAAQPSDGSLPESEFTASYKNVELSWMKGAVVLVVLLGLTWTFGLLYFDDHLASLFWAYVFTVLNSLQGFFIFLFHCLLNEKVQKEYKKIVRRTGWLPDCIRVNYGGAKSYTSSTPNNSTSGNKHHAITPITQEQKYSLEALQKLWSGRFRKRSSTSSIINKSTSSGATPVRWNWQQDKADVSGVPDSGVHLEPNGHSLYSEPTEDPGGYLEPVSIRVDSGMQYDDIHGEPMSNIEGSMVDSNYLFDTSPRQQAPTEPLINVDKYKIQSPEENDVKPKVPLVDEEKGAITDSDSDDDDCCKKAFTETDFEDSPLMDEKSLSDKDDDDDDDLSDDDDTLQREKKKLKRLSSDSGNVDTSSSLNDLNKEDCEDNVNLSAPNIMPGTLKKDNRDTDSPSSNRSLPDIEEKPSEEVAVEKLKKALTDSNDGLIQLYHGKTADHRLSRASQEALDAHNYRMSSSDC